MGQKTSPLILRQQKNIPIIVEKQQFAKYLILRNYLNNFFSAKGLIINKLVIKESTNGNLIEINFIVSRTSKIYTKIFRKNLKRARTYHRYKQMKLKSLKKHLQKKNLKLYKNKISPTKNKNNLHIKEFLLIISKITSKKKINIKIKRIDNKINNRILRTLIKKANKIGLKRYLKYGLIRTLIIATTLLLQANDEIKSNLLLNLISKQFAWIPKKNQKKFFTFLRDFFRLIYNFDKQVRNRLEGIRLNLNGRINGKTKASELHCIVGSISAQTISANIDYATATSYSKFGTYGWKLYINKTLNDE